MYPGVLLLHPDTAASLLEYRVDRIAGGALSECSMGCISCAALKYY